MVDVSKYLEYLAKSVETLLWPWGFQAKDLLRLLEDPKIKEKRPSRKRGDVSLRLDLLESSPGE
jgi:hypothetical protein